MPARSSPYSTNRTGCGMGRTCTICTHDQRNRIDWELVTRTPYRTIAGQYGVSKPALQRHAKVHIPQKLALAEKAEQAAEADKLLWDLRRLQQHTLKTLLAAEKDGDPLTLLKAVGEARRNVELMSKLRGELDESPRINVSLSVSDEWVDVRTKIVEALDPYPEARESVVRALETAT